MCYTENGLFLCFVAVIFRLKCWQNNVQAAAFDLFVDKLKIISPAVRHKVIVQMCYFLPIAVIDLNLKMILDFKHLGHFFDRLAQNGQSFQRGFVEILGFLFRNQ